MNYKSTRDSSKKVTSAQAIAQGISDDGGLFLPDIIPSLTLDEIDGLANLSYKKRAAFILGKFLTDFTDRELSDCCEKAYNAENFVDDGIVKISKIDNYHVLELWHGKTCAFKDIALQILPHLLTASAKKTGNDKEIVILVATSGDTGKAALEGFCGVEGTKIIVFYPEDGVSIIQKKQMTTQKGKNVRVCAVKGNFDDCQNGVKKIFTDTNIAQEISKKGCVFSSANSINWGRLAPQIVYYISAYIDLMIAGEVKNGQKINVVVPTGNFGNILAAYYAKEMGLPIAKLICASNKNNILTDFIKTGVYDTNREFFLTTSPSMDILISSNLERLVYLLYGDDDAAVRKLYAQLKNDGKFEVSSQVSAKLQADFYGGFSDDDGTKTIIKSVFEKHGYLLDTHTAVAVKVYNDYLADMNDTTPTIIASTANPYKFTGAVLAAVAPDKKTDDDFEMLNILNEVSKLDVPVSLSELSQKSPIFLDTISPGEMTDYVLKTL